MMRKDVLKKNRFPKEEKDTKVFNYIIVFTLFVITVILVGLGMLFSSGPM